ncbi:DUF1285 domain-containing protein [Aliiroseovarius sp. KMU-50]|uniref:DUF1285 domain-containing protein n=1 Tax=Aliiroseovarius salicola TaxID=3009082 RepID=A0ABT4W0N9_9RHOB|nr:DUF1285 domain-containing protein [Aliiroseovarius sp. KMU-50]MDA5093565.1 DUF1285 domain-containing protein [Aliiroseovarius sp. KMU-50]
MTKAATDGKSPMKPSKTTPDQLADAVQGAAKKGIPPVHLWHPPFCGDMDMRIARDGQWFHEGRPITRPGLVRLFASILRKDDDGYMLVTPVERFRIKVDDVPFVAEDLEVNGTGRDQDLAFTTNVGDVTHAGPETKLRIEQDEVTGEPTPYVLVRGGLEARIDRKTFYRLVELACHEEQDNGRWFGLWSNGVFFRISHSDDLED